VRRRIIDGNRIGEDNEERRQLQQENRQKKGIKGGG
jgi:hypothetical protein